MNTPIRFCVALLLCAGGWCGETEAETSPLVHLTFPQREPTRPVTRTWTVPGEVVTSWVGNTFGGEHHQNGFGRWVQNGIAPAAFAVSPEGTAVAGLDWDEAGRCIGLYKDGTVNGRLVAQYDMRGGHGAWGFGSSNHAVAVDGGVYPKSMAIAGEYGFVVSVKPVQGVTGLVRVVSLGTGAEVGTIAPGAPVGYLSGWVDISHVLAAHRRRIPYPGRGGLPREEHPLPLAPQVNPETVFHA